MNNDNTAAASAQDARCLADDLAARLEQFVAPLVCKLDAYLDRRLVRTFVRLVQTIITFRHPTLGLVLSELGAYLLSPDHAPAGTKRISNLLRSAKWDASLIEHFLWRQGQQRLDDLRAAEQEALVVWDTSVDEKPESVAAEGLCPVRSAKAQRLKRKRRGFGGGPPGPPIVVPGLHWLSLLVLGLRGQPTLAAMTWVSSRGPQAGSVRSVESDYLLLTAQAWGRSVLHVWDRGFAGQPWLTQALQADVRFVVRWPGRYKLVDAQGHERKAWQILQGKRSRDHQRLWFARYQCWCDTGVVAVPVTHPAFPQHPLWLIASRPGGGRKPWYLLTNEPVARLADLWRVVLAYGRRWQIEMTWRYSKSELAMQSPRLWFWDNRLKLLLIVSVAYAFLLGLLELPEGVLYDCLLRQWCHRTGRWVDAVRLPLYRLRSALSRLWQAHPPNLPAPGHVAALLYPLLNSG
jgi:hypothetical protein